MPLIERDVVCRGQDGDGNATIDLPITRLGNIEDGAEVKAAPSQGDYFPVIDGADGGKMKKAPYAAVCVPPERTINGQPLTGDVMIPIFAAGDSPPADTGLLWIDTTAGTGGLKYHNGTDWVHVPVAYT